LRAVLWGSAARRVVSGLVAGRIVGVFRHSFYLADSEGALACVGAPLLGPGPLNLLCAPGNDIDFRELLGSDDPVAHRGNVLDIGNSLRLRIGGGSEWYPPPIAAGWRPEVLAAALATLADLTATPTPTGGFSGTVAALARGHAMSDAGQDPLLRLAGPAIAALGDWLASALSARSTSPPDSAAILIGLGPGLTPSGDDLLGGMMIALAAFGRRDLARRTAEWVLPLAATRTGAVSAAHLACAALGEGSAALHDMLGALALGDGRHRIAAALDGLAALGHSSGWDMLTGAVLACAALAR
jgi:Protein of unknown function (DUF2877)